MDLYVRVKKEKIQNQNGRSNQAFITVDLQKLWSNIVNRFTHIHLEVEVKIPILPDEYMRIQLTREVEVEKIIDQKVEFVVTYGEEEDATRELSGEAILSGYQLIGTI